MGGEAVPILSKINNEQLIIGGYLRKYDRKRALSVIRKTPVGYFNLLFWYSVGVQFLMDLKTREKYSGSLKPTEPAISAME